MLWNEANWQSFTGKNCFSKVENHFEIKHSKNASGSMQPDGISSFSRSEIENCRKLKSREKLTRNHKFSQPSQIHNRARWAREEAWRKFPWLFSSLYHLRHITTCASQSVTSARSDLFIRSSFDMIYGNR